MPLDEQRSTEESDPYEDNSPYDPLAEGISDFLCALATDQSHDEDYRRIVLTLFMHLYSRLEDGESPPLVAVQRRVLVHVKKTVARNLSEKRFAYPMLVRLLLNSVGLPVDEANGSHGKEELATYIRGAVRAGFRTAISLTPSREAELLPEGMINDRSTGSIRDTRYENAEKYSLQYD